MKALHTLLPLIIAPTFFLTNINQLQAGEVVYEEANNGDSFTFDRAVWRNRRDLLVLRGTGTPGRKIDAYIADTEQYLGSDTVNRRGYWGIRLNNQSSAPCSVLAVNGSYVQEKTVTSAPANCISADDTPSDEPTTPENTPPVISGTPRSYVDEGQEYRFAPTANDTDGDELTFSITNRPSWAHFNPATGVLRGTPDSASVGTYENIVITVSDGEATASLRSVDITVVETEPTVGDVSLTWVAPSTRTDGSSLDMSEIGGYKVYMGTTDDNLEQVLDLADSSISDYVVEGLATGDYYFAVTTYDTEGNESSYSNIVIKSTM
jgi:hypothetical protein